MSDESDLQWTLISFVHRKKLTLEDAIELVDDVEQRTDSVEYACDESDKKQATEDLRDMKDTVAFIWNKLTA